MRRPGPFPRAVTLDKSPDAFRTISEVAGDLDLPQHVLRFWETRFGQIRPLKRGGGRRYYRPDDVDLLKGIRHLLYGEGYTIRGVQRILKEEGVRFVMDVWREGAAQPQRGGGRLGDDEADLPETADARRGPSTPSALSEAPGWGREVVRSEVHARVEPDVEAYEPPASDHDVEPPSDPFDEPAPGFDAEAPIRALDPEIRAAHVLAQRFAPVPRAEPAPAPAPSLVAPPARVELPAPRVEPEPPRGGVGQFFDRLRPATPPPVAVVSPIHTGDADAVLSRDDVRRLQATLFELLECKRLLDQAR